MTCIVCGGPIEEGRRHGQPPSEASVVSLPDQLPVQARGTDLEHITRPGHHVLHVQDNAQLLAHTLAILVADAQILRVRGTRQPVKIDAQQPLLSHFPLDVEYLEPFGASNSLCRLSNLIQVHCEVIERRAASIQILPPRHTLKPVWKQACSGIFEIGGSAL